MALGKYRADLHVHTLLSPCAELEMMPSLIAFMAQNAGLDMLGVCDHNSCENAGAVMKAAEGTGVKVFPGLEVQSVEGVHLMCLFEELEEALSMQKIVYEKLSDIDIGNNGAEEQIIVDENDEFVDYCKRPIAYPSSMDIDEVYGETVSRNGIVIPSHIDRIETGLCGVLGIMPDSPRFGAVEITANISKDAARKKFLVPEDVQMVCNSDAHWLSAIGSRCSVFTMERRTIAEMRLAISAESERSVDCA